MQLFVYGSLSEGMVHYKKVAEYVQSARPGVIHGHCFRLPVGYPVFLAHCDATSDLKLAPTAGVLLEMTAPDLLYKLLDEYHGVSVLTPEKSLFFKTNVEVQLNDGETVSAVTYAMNPAKLPPQAEYLPNGDWHSSLKERPAMPDVLSDKQSTYIRRLGASTGREIVPIDLALYRELMKLELIVDKGRRLALTKLGKEVYRFLV
jgi:gamma-glutamylcyclotransferase (GGCT)/AIG2-like uncharacterized protein YtfP